MLLALAICDKDLPQAQRLIQWIGFLSEQAGESMADQEILLLFSSKATECCPEQSHRVVAVASRVFGEVVNAEVQDQERGWPGEANRMFLSFLDHLEVIGQPGFFLEPDGVPTRADWFQSIQDEYNRCNQPFLGGYVPTPPPHMTGIGVYPSTWRQYAPALSRVPDSAGWDTYCAGDIYPHCHFTPLIQHVFKRHEPGWSIPGLNALDKRAVLFHQDKQGKLIRLLDDSLFGGACARHPTYGRRVEDAVARSMTKFYSTVNATKAIVARGGYRFVFDAVDAFAGSVPGVYATEIQAEQDLLDDLAQNPTTGVREIDQHEWERLAKKNWIHPVLATSKRLSETSPPAMLAPRPVQTPIIPTPSQKAAVVVAEPVSVVGDPSAPPGLSQIKDINEVLRVDTVQPSQPPPGGAKAKVKRQARKG